MKRTCLLLFAISFISCTVYGQIEEEHPQNKEATQNNISAFYNGNEQSDIDLPVETEEEYNARMQWWKDARYGMFIHFGLYSYLAGEYKGEVTPRIAEWIQNTLKIPLSEYKKLVKKFNPTKFDADVWAGLAKAAGMKYVILTSKHHDGFALFDSKVSDYDIMSTPYGKDMVRLLKEACVKHGLKFGLYYSHTIDWENPNAYIGKGVLEKRMNLVDFDASSMDRSIYLKEKAFPQLKEILTNYGKIDIIWFDMGGGLSNNEIRQFVKIARELQPGILVSSRVGDSGVDPSDLHREMLFDFYTPDDNYFTSADLPMPWEMCGTTNSSWGYRKNDTNWRSANFITRTLMATASRNGNYLLNVGPDALGQIPAEAAKNLTTAGKWIHTNSEAIYGTSGSPFPWNFDWGYVTQKPGKLYLSLFNWPEGNVLHLNGLLSKVNDVRVLGVSSTLSFTQDGQFLSVDLKAMTKNELGIVIEVQYADACGLRIANEITQSLDHTIRLDRITSQYNRDSKLSSWTFKVNVPGKYTILLMSNEKGDHKHPVWEGTNQHGSIQVAGRIIPVTLKRDEEHINPTLFFYKEITSNIGEVEFPKKGTYSLHLKGFEIEAGKWTKGLALSEIKLLPVSE